MLALWRWPESNKAVMAIADEMQERLSLSDVAHRAAGELSRGQQRRLEERRKNGGGQLSGGEQQMLDVPVEGLVPVIVEEIVSQVKTERDAGVTILFIEHKLTVRAELADRHYNYVIKMGRIVHESSAMDFVRDAEIRDRYLGVGA